MSGGWMRTAGIAVLTMAVAGSAGAETGPATGTERVFSAARLARAVGGAVPQRVAQDSAGRTGRKRDSLLNGALIGAAIGGVGGSALIVASRGGSDNIPKAMWNVSLAPALLGAVAGAVVDAVIEN
jgi:hypothetical protein